jgi:surfeit locus 1 family protein
MIGHVLVVIGVIILINLGLWQLRRMEQRQELNAAIRAGLEADPVTLTGEAVDPEELGRRRVSVTGTFDNEAAIAIRNRPFQGRPGVHLVVPLRIKGSDKAVLVDRGWIPQEDADPQAWDAYDVTGEVSLKGIAQASRPQPEGYLVPVDPTPGPGETGLDTWFRVNIDRIQEQIPYPLLPIYVEQSPDPDADPAEPPLQEGDPVLEVGPHLGYALQWFTFALLLVITYGVFIRQELKHQREKSEQGPNQRLKVEG